MKKVLAGAKKNKKSLRAEIDGLELLAFICAFVYVHSVNTNLHHYMYWRTIEHPLLPSLAVALALIAYTTHKNKKLSILGACVVAIILTASFIWLSGFRVNAVPLR